MAWLPTGSLVFASLAALLQVAIGFRLIFTAPRDGRAATLGSLFVVNGVITGIWAAIAGVQDLYDPGAAYHPAFDALASTAGMLDMATNLMIVLFAFLYPKPPRDAKVLEWPALLLLALVLPFAMQAITPYNIWITRAFAGAMTWSTLAVAFLPFELTFMVLMLRWANLWRQPHSATERRQFALIFAAFGMRASHLLILIPAHFVAHNQEPGITYPMGSLVGYGGLYVAMLATLVVTVVVLVRQRRAQGMRRSTDFVLAFVALGALEGIVNSIGLFAGDFTWWQSISGRLDVLVVRPILIMLAMTSGGFIDAHWGLDRMGPIAAAVLFGGAMAAGTFDVATVGRWPIAALVGVAAGVVGHRLAARAWTQYQSRAA